MARLHIDGEIHEVEAGDNLLAACLSLGYDLPYFCWHPAMGSIGACRQCAVKQYRGADDRQGRIVMACMTPVADGARISISDAEAAAFRAAVIEWLMRNHPHDCPVCDEGGECHLQDMTVLTGHARRRYRGLKRTWRNQDLGPFVTHEMNRCIQCYRCVRFYRDYAGGRDFDAQGLRDQVYFGRHADGPLESEFAGNLVEVCPTGVFTDKTLSRHYARKWDQQYAPSVCVHCGVGCNISPGERYGTLRRVQARYNGAINGYFLCDRGRYGYEFVNAPGRLRQPLVRQGKTQEQRPAAREEALAAAAIALRDGRALGIGSPRASIEANFALRQLVGEERFYLGLASEEQPLLELIIDILRQGPARTPSLKEMEAADAVLLLGEDVSNTAPMLALALRQCPRQAWIAHAAALKIPAWDANAVRQAAADVRPPFFIITPAATRLDELATGIIRQPPAEIARLGLAVARKVAGGAAIPGLAKESQQLADEIAAALAKARRPLIVSGTSAGSADIVRAAGALAAALCAGGRECALCYAVAEANSMGLALLGGRPLADALAAVRQGAADDVVILENDLYRRAGRQDIDAFFAAARHVVAIDHSANATTEQAEVVLPAGVFAEADGTLVNNEGRAQRFFQVYVPESPIQESWRWLQDLLAAAEAGRRSGGAAASPGSGWRSLDEINAACAAAIPALGGIAAAAPGAAMRCTGQKIARAPHRYSGRTAMAAQRNVHEAPPPPDPDSALAFSMEGYPGRPPSPLLPYFWAPRWNSAQAVHKFQREIAGPLHDGDPGVRLLEPGAAAQVFADHPLPQAFARRPGQWLVLGLPHVFGSEELSSLAPSVAQMAPRPYVALARQDAEELGLAADETIELRLGGIGLRLPLVLHLEMPPGTAGLPAGLPGLSGIALPAWGEIALAREKP